MRTGYVSPLCIAFALGLAANAPAALAQTLYKLIDKNGKVTYAEKPPKDYDGKVIRMDIDPNANTATLPKPPAPSAESRRAEPDGKRVEPEGAKKTSPGGDRVQAARDKLEAAKRAYDQALNNPGAGDVNFIGNKGGGSRPVFSDSYAARLAALEYSVKQAEEELKRAEGG